MSATGQFTGLTMPVFTAFGWAGEEAAIKFALTQLELFIGTLHRHLSREAQQMLPYYGLDKETQSVYLAANESPEEGPMIVFYARPMSFELRLAITDEATLNRGLKEAEKQPANWHRLITQLGESWTFRLQQSHVDEETGEVSHYQDLFKDKVSALDPETCETITSRAAFLNTEPKWVTPVYLSKRTPAQQAAAMRTEITRVMADDINDLLSILMLFTRPSRTPASLRSDKRPQKSSAAASVLAPVSAGPSNGSDDSTRISKKIEEESFVYMADLKPLHIRRGFINLTPDHWPFFSESARASDRDVTVYYDGRYDKQSSVWRLQPSNQARLVLGDESREWLEDTFDANTAVKVQATRLADDEIQIRLTPA